jgi:hypothetical protein
VRRREIVMRRTYGGILEGCKYNKDLNRGKRVKKTVAKPEVGEQLRLPFPEKEELRRAEDKDKK